MESIKEILKDVNKTNDFLEENKGLVFHVILKTFPSVLDTYEREDYIQDGLISLYKAMNRYDETKNIKFFTFAYHVIRCDLITRITRQKNKLSQCNKNVLSLNVEALGYENLEEIDLLESEDNVENICMDNIRNRQLQNAIDVKIITNLKPEYLKIFKYLLAGKTQSDIAKILNTSRQNLNNKVNNIRHLTQSLKMA